MWTPTPKDLTAEYGATFSVTFALYADARITKYRGEWLAWHVYEKGEAVVLPSGVAYVALLTTEHTEPGSGGAGPFWSAATPRNLTGCTVKFVCGTAFTVEPSFEALAGRINVRIEPAVFAKAPSSESYYVKVTEEGGAPSYIAKGTMLFKNP